MKNQLSIGNFDINLPDETSSYFYIFHDLAELFGKEFQNEAVKDLKSELKEGTLKPSIDFESDYTSIRTKSPEVIFEVAQIITKLSNIQNSSAIEWEEVLRKLKNWTRPKPQKWEVGSFISVQLSDNSFCFAQIIGIHPTIALIDFKSNTEEINQKLLFSKRIITILHLHKMQIQNRTWKVIGHSTALVADQNEGPWGETDGKITIESATGNWLKSVGDAFYNLGEKRECYLNVIIKEGWLKKLKKYWR